MPLCDTTQGLYLRTVQFRAGFALKVEQQMNQKSRLFVFCPVDSGRDGTLKLRHPAGGCSDVLNFLPVRQRESKKVEGQNSGELSSRVGRRADGRTLEDLSGITIITDQ